MPDVVSIRLFGPVAVTVADRPVPLAGVKLQSVLAQLALEAPRAVSDDRLIEELWGDAPPGNPANALQALVSNLRRLLGRTAVVRQGAGYVLGLEPTVCDANRLAPLVDDGRVALAAGDLRRAAERFRAAIELHRGAPLAELADQWFARDAIVQLGEQMLAAYEGLVDAEIALGRHEEVRGLLVDLVTKHPLRERFHAQLVLTLYRSGRQADALRAVSRARRYLLDELGLEPGPELCDLERAVLNHDPALRAPVPLAASGLARATIPEPVTSFLGRQAELAALDLAARLTTIVGPAGVGKSRLAIEWARAQRHATAAFFVELAPTDMDGVADAVAAAVGADDRAGGDATGADPVDRAIARLGPIEAVLVIDNCEHVVDAVADCVARLRAECPQLRVVATSRESLELPGEQLLVLEPFEDELARQLFVERAKLVQPSIEHADDGAVTELCRHLDGLPLAIELAAARTRSLAVPEIADRLHDRFRLLRSTQREPDERHIGLGTAIDWSYDLLFEEERRTFRWLSVFSGGATSSAIEEVCGPGAFELAGRLVHRSLVTADTSGGEVRIRMLESLRDYGLERLAEAGEQQAASAQHVQWCRALLERIDAGSRGNDQLVWLDLLDQEHDNVRAALTHATRDDPAAALAMVGSLFAAWMARGRAGELRQWYDICLAAVSGSDVDPGTVATALAIRAYLAEPNAGRRWSGEFEDVLTTAERQEHDALAMLESAELDDAERERRRAGITLLTLATRVRRAAAGLAVDPHAMTEQTASAYTYFEQTGDDFALTGLHTVGALSAFVVGDTGLARAHTNAARRLASRTGERYTGSRVEYLLGLLAEREGRIDDAYRHSERALRLLDEIGAQDSVTAQARVLATLADQLGETDLADQWRSFIAGRTGGWSHFDSTIAAASHNRDGLAARMDGDLERAEAAHRRALELYLDADLPAGLAHTECCLGSIALRRGLIEDAVPHLVAAVHAATASGDDGSIALVTECVAGIEVTVMAARLLGGAEALRAPGGPPRHTVFDEDLEAQRTRLVENLGARAVDEAMTEGTTMSGSELCHLARHMLEQHR